MAAQKRPELAVQERPEQGSRPVRRLRKTGFVPGIVYGGGSGECRSFKVDARELNVEALPTDIPDHITIDVSHLEAAATMHLSEVSAPQGVEFLDDPEDTIIATITVPTEEPEEPEVEEETELVGEGEAAEGEEAEAQAEGATADEAEAGGGAGGGES